MPHVLADFFPATFPALALAHFLALLSPGPDFFLITGHAIRGRFTGSAWICVGIAIGNALYIIVAVAGWAGMQTSPRLFTGVEAAGAVYLFWMGSMLIRTKQRSLPLVGQAASLLSPVKQCMAGLSSAVLNPKNAIFYLALMSAFMGPEVTSYQLWAVGAWMTGIVLLWDLGVAACIASPVVQNVLQDKIFFIERISGGGLLVFAIALFRELLLKLY